MRFQASKHGNKRTGDAGDSISFTAHTILADRSFLDSGHTLYDALNEMGVLYGRIKRALFKDIVRSGRPSVSFKNEYLRKYGITARQFNAIRYDLDGNIKSAVEVLKLRTSGLEDRLKSIRKWIKTKESKRAKIVKNSAVTETDNAASIHSLGFAIHHKKRKRYSLEEKLSRLKADLEKGRVRICFGSKDLFHKQFSLEENGDQSHDEWLSDWKKARSSQAFCLGSKDETGGNQTCTLYGDGSLRIRVPDCLHARHGKFIMVSGVKFAYGQDVINQALEESRAITHRFVQNEKGWHLHTSVDIPKPKPATFKPIDIGCIGVDVNEKEVAVSETDRFGNLVWSKSYPACVKDRSPDQTEAVYGDICAIIVGKAAVTGKPIAHETLDFRKKKASLKEQGVSYARMLSGFAYKAFLTMLARRAFRHGVEVFSDNPAFTSVIGKINYMSRYGTTPHEAAALAIARRIQGYSESPDPARTASPLPARNRGEHVWKYWRRQKDSRVCRYHHTLYNKRSLQDSPGCAEFQNKASSRSTVQSSRPPAGRSIGGKASGVLPRDNSRGLGESGRDPLTLTGSSTVRLPS